LRQAVGSALGAAATEAQRTIVGIATLDLRIDYMKAAKPGIDIVVVGECVKITRQIVFARGRAYQESEADPIASATGTFIMTELRSGGIMTELRSEGIMTELRTGA
jgi:acyl-coenzyme A thioesterase PaaI-like protein